MKPEFCFWAGKQDYEHFVFCGYEPCLEVKALWGDHIVIMECTEAPNFEGQPGIVTQKDVYLYPTGRWVAINRESGMFDHVPNKQAVMDEGRMLVDRELFDLILGASR